MCIRDRDWIWNSGGTTTVTNQQATIVEGVIGVYEKTIRLDIGGAL